jgi:hypothetical protein
MIFLPPMPPEQTASWIGLLDLHERLADGWDPHRRSTRPRLWFGLCIGLIFWLFTTANPLQVVLSTAFLGATFGLVFALIGYGFTRGQRDFSSITQVVATKYEVLVEHKSSAHARELLAGLPGALPNPFE